MYRIRVHVHTRAKHIPWEEVLRPGRSILYSWLHKQDQTLAAEVHGSPAMAPFGYSAPTFPSVAAQSGVYAAGGDGWWEIGTSDRRIAAAWAAALQDKPLLNWGGIALTVTGVDAVRPMDFSAGRAVLKTTTPVCLRTPSRDGSRVLLPGEPTYVAALRASLRNRARVLGIDHGDRDPLARIRWSGSHRSFVVSGSGVPRKGCRLKVEITAPPDLLRAVWTVGIGQQTGAGFGWVGDDANPHSEELPP